MKRQFNLPEGDVEYLDSRGLNWETLLESNFRWLIIHDYPIPNGYNVELVSIALHLDVHYPVTQIDMIYFFPPLGKKSGRSINAITFQQIGGTMWQRWSRHRTRSNPWKPGEDDVASHLVMFDQILNQELIR